MGGAKAPKGKGKSPGASPNKAKSKAKKHATPLAEPDGRAGRRGAARPTPRAEGKVFLSLVNALCRPNIKFMFSNNRKTRASYRVTGTEPQQRTRTHWTVSNVE